MGVFVNSGIGAQLVAVAETTYGVVPAGLAAGGVQPYEFNSETLELKKTTVQGMGLHAGGLHNRSSRRVLTMYQAGGGITMDLPSQYLNRWLVQMFGSAAQPLAALTQDGATGAYQGIHGPGNTKGSSLCIQKSAPSVDGTAGNPFTYVGCKFTDWTLNVATGAIATLAATVDARNELAGAGNSDPLNGSVPNLALFAEANTNSIFHFREATLYSGGTLATTGTGSALSSPPSVPATTVPIASPYPYLTAVTITGGTITFVYVNGVQVGTTAGTYAVPANGIVSITYSSAPTWTWKAAYTSISGNTAMSNVKSAQLKYAMHMDTTRIFLGSQGFKAEPIENAFRDITGQFVVEWLNSETMYNAFAADSALSLELKFLGPSIGSGSDFSTLDLIIPSVRLDGESPKVSGPAVVTQNVSFTGLDDGTNNPIQATYWTIDSA